MSRPLSSCYSLRFIAFSLGCALIVVGAALFSRSFERGSAMRIALAAVEGLATGAVIVTSILRIRSLDEFQQRVQLEALAIAFAGTGVLATAYGFLINAGLPNIEWGAMVWPMMVALWAVGLLIANWRYR